jgi:hypothetical protein
MLNMLQDLANDANVATLMVQHGIDQELRLLVSNRTPAVQQGANTLLSILLRMPYVVRANHVEHVVNIITARRHMLTSCLTLASLNYDSGVLCYE